MLEYRVLSSDGKTVYKVKFEGVGKDLKAYCTCPAGKKGGKFCKHISGLLNGDTTKMVEPSDKIEALAGVMQGSPLLSKNEDFVSKKEKDRFVHNGVKISTIDDLYDYLLTTINEKIIIEYNKKLGRIAIYKAEYFKNGNPKYAVKNRLAAMEYSEDLSWFNIDHQNYKHFAHAGPKFIEGVTKALSSQ